MVSGFYPARAGSPSLARHRWEANEANRKARQQRRKENKEEWQQRDLERSNRVQMIERKQLEIDRLRELASNAHPVAQINDSRIFQLEGKVYAQQIVNGKVEIEVAAESWRQNDGELVFWGDAIGRQAGIMIATRPENSEIRFLPNGNYKVVAKEGTQRGGTSLVIPLDD